MAEGGREGNMKVGDGGISNCVEIRGFSKKTSLELMEMYFENSRRSGGGDLEEVKIRDEVAYITFKDPEVAHNVASRSSHQLDGHTLTVTLFHPLPPKPCYQNRGLIQGLNNAITEELLINFLETKTKTEVTELLYGELDGNVVVTFSNNIDIVQLGKIFQKSSIEGVFLKVEPVEISNCILVQNLHPSSSYDAILYYFENKRRSGGGDVERVDMKTEERYCLIYFEDPSVIDRVLERQSHSVDGVNFEIHLHHECLGLRSSRNKSDLYLRVSSPGNKDSSSLEYENTGNRAKYKTSGSVSSDPENESDFAEVQERQEENGKEKLDILLRYRKASGAQFVNKTITLPCTEDFLRYWNFYTKTSEGKQMLDIIARTHQCSVAVSNDVEDLFIFEAIDQCFKQVSDIEEFVNMVIHSVYQNAQTSLCLCCFSVEVVIQDDFFQRVKQRKDMDVFWIAKGGEHNSAAMYAVSRKENKEIMTGKITEIIDTAQKCFENHEEKVHADNIWKRVMETFGYLEEIKWKFLKTKIIYNEKQNAYILKGVRNETKAAAEHLEKLLKAAHVEVHGEEFSIGYQFEIFTNPEMCNYIDSMIQNIPVPFVWIPNHHTQKLHIFSRSPECINRIYKSIERCVHEKGCPLSRDMFSLDELKSLEELRKKHKGKVFIQPSDKSLLVTAASDIFESVYAALQDICSQKNVTAEAVSKQLKPDHKTDYDSIRSKELLSKKGNEISKCIEVHDAQIFKKLVKEDLSKFEHLANQHDVTICKIEKANRFGFEIKGSQADVMFIFINLSEKIKSKEQTFQHDDDILAETVEAQMEASSPYATNIPSAKYEKHILPQQGKGNQYPAVVEGNEYQGNNDNAKPEDHGLEQREWSYPNGKKIILAKATTCDADVIIIPGSSDKEGQSQFGNKKLVKLKVPDGTEGKAKMDLQEEVEQTLTKILEKTVGICIHPVEGWNFFLYLKCFLYGLYTCFMKNEGKVCPIEYVILLVEDTSDYIKAGKIIQKSFRLEQDKSEVIADQRLLLQKQGPFFKRIQVKVTKGQLHEAQAEVIVNTVDRSLDLTKGVISSSLLDKAGNGIQKELQQYQGKSRFGEVLKTGGGTLPKPCKAIFHGVLYVYEGHSESVKVFQDFLAGCLEDANNKYRSIAFPPIGTGKLRYPRDLVALLLFQSVAKFEEAHPTSKLEEVIFVIYEKDQETLKVFEEMYRRYFGI